MKKKLNKIMSRKVVFTEEQIREIAERCGANPDEISEATTCGGVGASTTRGDMGYDTPGFDTKSDPKFWGDALNHQKSGFERVGDKK